MARVAQVVDHLFGIIYTLLGLIAARGGAGFVQFIRGITEPLYVPFRGMVASPEALGGYRFEWPLLIAIVVYALLHLGIKRLLRMLGTRPTEF